MPIPESAIIGLTKDSSGELVYFAGDVESDPELREWFEIERGA